MPHRLRAPVAAPRWLTGVVRWLGQSNCTSCLRARLEVPFGVRLRSLRLAAGLSQQELAQRAGLTVNTVRVHEAGMGALRAATVERLVQVLGQGLLESERQPS